MSNHFDNFQMPNAAADNASASNTFTISTFSISDLNPNNSSSAPGAASSSSSSFNNHHLHNYQHTSNSSPSSSNHFTLNSTNSNSNFFSTNNTNNDIFNANPSSSVKETGIIEKMLVSYGFIQCCERQARLFFHFSQYLGNTDHLRIGDPVEYEMSYDRRTGKPVAINIRKITSDDLMSKLIKTERVSGVIATEITGNGNREGRVAFENLGEFFFLPFTQEDVTDAVVLKAKDKVSFIIVTDDSGNYRAKSVQLETASSMKYQGNISSIKDTFGFIERSDDMSNIFFHSSDCVHFKQLQLGDYVEFNITSRKNKDLAINVVKVANTAEEIDEKIYRGQVNKYAGRANQASGLIRCTELGSKEFPFYDKDFRGSFTLSTNDWVSFQVCTDHRNQTQRACNVQFLEDTFSLNKEERERGYIASLKETYGFIKCPSKEGSLIYFRLSELLDPNLLIRLNDEVEFTLSGDPATKKSHALRISILPNGTLFNILRRSNNHNSSNANFNSANNDNKPQLNNSLNNNAHNFESNNNNNNFPLIDFATSSSELNDTQHQQNKNYCTMVMNGNNGDSYNNVWSNPAKDSGGGGGSGGEDSFGNFINSSSNRKEKVSNNSFDLSYRNFGGDYFDSISNNNISDHNKNGIIETNCCGLIVALKDSYCFIESIDGENEFFGHQSQYIDSDLEMGQTVEFTGGMFNGKWKATDIQRKPTLTMYEDELSEVYTGFVVRTIQMFQPDQPEYTGLIHRTTTNDLDAVLNDSTYQNGKLFDFSMISFKFLKDYIEVGDMVNFQLGTNPVTKKLRAYNVEVVRNRIKGSIFFITRIYGFVKAEIDGEAKKIYFNRSEVVGGMATKLKVGDVVDFYLVDNRKSEKSYAINLNKLEDGSVAPSFGNTGNDGERLALFKNLLASKEKEVNGPKVVVIRQPLAPDGTKGFKQGEDETMEKTLAITEQLLTAFDN